ncbi:hypothetical protein [Rhizobium mongolense]|uniref:Uncharacterized protein n=1 Tax=Rhizobium mongolense TaxID=57676 RepID=A0A7W6WHF4_9HYPH|nr:hypothetical protein [Rhizobium mongolense]MBB4277759.1 hypothetical protein [Rhizobium mongolense]
MNETPIILASSFRILRDLLGQEFLFDELRAEPDEFFQLGLGEIESRTALIHMSVQIVASDASVKYEVILAVATYPVDAQQLFDLARFDVSTVGKQMKLMHPVQARAGLRLAGEASNLQYAKLLVLVGAGLKRVTNDQTGYRFRISSFFAVDIEADFGTLSHKEIGDKVGAEVPFEQLSACRKLFPIVRFSKAFESNDGTGVPDPRQMSPFTVLAKLFLVV